MAFRCTIALTLLLLDSPAWGSAESSLNQDKPTHHFLKPRENHPNHIIAPNQKPAIPDLQVGCADGNIREAHSDKPQQRRKKRSYTPWTSNQVNYQVPYQSISVWKPPIYQLSRPYYIPIYGVRGRTPIYYPPQPLRLNPGDPQNNRKTPFRGPTYLPPAKPTTMTVEDRFHNGDDDDDRPVWGGFDGKEVTEAPAATVAPTRRRRPPGARRTTPPPLVHAPGDVPRENAPPQAFQPPRTTSRPRPTTARPVPQPVEPSRCVWAIISCCSTTGEIVNDCFEARGCPGPFWDSNPCDSDFARAAIAAALNYYQ